MDLTEKNGQPSMEEILASIRRIIAEEPADAIFLTPKTAGASAPVSADTDDATDFKLPSMFRPTSPQISDNASIAPTRLTDALKLASSAVENDIKQNGVQLESGAYASLSSLKPQPRLDVTPAAPVLSQPVLTQPAVTVKAEPAVAVANQQVVSPTIAAQIPAPFAPAEATPITSEAPVARKMASFSDSRFKAISTPAAVPASAPVAIFEVAPVVQPITTNKALVAAPVPAVEAAVSQPTETKASSGVEDQTAELLRPMLRQWLTENMPRMVEKALFMEVNTTNGQKKD